MPSSRDVLVDRAARDVEDTLEHIRRRLRAQPGALWRAIELGVLGLVGLLDPRGRIAKDVDKVIALAKRHDAGEDAGRLAREHLDDTLRLVEINLVMRVKDPEFARVLDASERIFRERLPDFARMVHVESPQDYPDLVRRAFPDRAEADRIVDENAAEIMGLVHHVERHPHLLRVPAGWVPKLAQLGRDLIEWKVADVRRELDEIYADGAPRRDSTDG